MDQDAVVRTALGTSAGLVGDSVGQIARQTKESFLSSLQPFQISLALR